MMGTTARLFEPRMSVSLEDLLPQDHFYRHVERSLDLSFVHDLVRPCYAAGGCPSIDPVVFFKLHLVLFFEGVRSERYRMAVAADRLSVRWFVGYDLHEALPDHSSLSKIRERYGVAIFRRFFDHIVEQCQPAGRVWGKALYRDSTQVAANADRDKMLPRFYVEAVGAPVDARFPCAPTEATLPGEPARVPTPLPLNLPPAAEAELTARNTARHDWIAVLGRPDRAVQRWHSQRRSDIWMNSSEPDATLMHKKGGATALGYHTHYAVDGGSPPGAARIILSVLVTPSEVMDN